MRIKLKPEKTPGAAELAAMTEDHLRGEYDRLMVEWMDRGNRGVRNTWAQFSAMDEVHLEQQRRYKPAVTGFPGGKAHA